jgi:hypothetical protein
LAAVDLRAYDTVLRVEESGFGQKRLGLYMLSEEARFTGLLDEFGDVPLVGKA